ncbi:MAG: hypothetical protein GWN16_01390 [Calditrichae bacterium]|nr:hypothetical protein [Calditrichia bacterium]NIW78178.1 hypothetical protein [Calditrichia bacterium]
MNIHKCSKAGPAVLFVYLVSLTLMPLFHVHPDEYHHDIRGSNYHSHHIPVHSGDANEANHETHHRFLQDFFLESINLYHPHYTFSQANDRIRPKNSPTLTIYYIFPGDFSLNRKDYPPPREGFRLALFSLPKEDYVLFFTNTSPPLA